jgi:predicted MFS family arabinose efflux permease
LLAGRSSLENRCALFHPVGLSYFFTEFGPNATTFVYPSELFPVDCRTTGHGIASAAGKLGAFIGVFLFPLLMHWHGLPAAELAAAIVSLLGMFVTLSSLPETKGKSLEQITDETVHDSETGDLRVEKVVDSRNQ